MKGAHQEQEDDEANTPDAQCGIQVEGGVGGAQG
jgi:hypothetical protein